MNATNLLCRLLGGLLVLGVVPACDEGAGCDLKAPTREASPGPKTSPGYRALKAAVLASCVLREDFSEAQGLMRDGSWWSGGMRWWNPAGVAPTLLGEFLVLRADSDGAAAELQSDAFFEGGGVVLGVWSSRWATEEGWTDTSVGVETWTDSEHEGIVLTDGDLGVFSDLDGLCGPGSTCTWTPLDRCGGWGGLRSAREPLILELRWDRSAGSVSLRRALPGPVWETCAAVQDASHVAGPLRLRLNANLADASDPAPEERLYVDFVGVR